jgi:hypothetical protein
MYKNLGTQWASSVPAFLALACTPMPFIFSKYGKYLRDRSKYAQEAQKSKQLLQLYITYPRFGASFRRTCFQMETNIF